MFGISLLPVIPIRKEPSSKSEMVSQLLFGYKYQVLHQQADWVQIKTFDDDYIGWINDTQFYEIDEHLWQNLTQPQIVTDFPFLKIEVNNQSMYIPTGSKIYFNNNFFKKLKFVFPSLKEVNLTVQNGAQMFLNVPYLWGGKTPLGIDCSGFTQVVFAQLGVMLKRDAYQQAEQGKLITFLLQTHCGDLAFFDNDEGKITHVGILLNSDTIIHASGKVRIDKIDNYGIINTDSQKYSHKLRFVKRMFDS